MLLQIGVSLCYKLGQIFLLQIRASVVTNWGKFYYELGAAITNYSSCYYKIERLLQIGQNVLQIGVGITN